MEKPIAPRTCVDANCLISGILSPNGAAGAVLDLARQNLCEVLVSTDIITEYGETPRKRSVAALIRKRGLRADQVSAAIEAFVGLVTYVTPEGEAPPCRDEDDRMYLHCALAGGAEYLITRDLDLLDIGHIASCRIADPAEFLQIMRQSTET